MDFDIEGFDRDQGTASFVVSERTDSRRDAIKQLLSESGGHRWQRVPPTEKRDKFQSSTVTVAVYELGAHLDGDHGGISEREVEMSFTKGSGAGGQHRNVTESAVRLVHKPTGIEVKICVERSQHKNRAIAWTVLSRKVAEVKASQQQAKMSKDLKDLRGCGMRGDKIKTYRVRDDQVTNHLTGNKMTLKKVLSGYLC